LLVAASSATGFFSESFSPMSIMNLATAAARFAVAAAAEKAAEAEALAVACQMVAEKSKSLIGVPHAEWPPLAASTLAAKDGVNTPLLETGKLRSSIEWNADVEHGYVGSNEDRAVWMELGTSRGAPPRSFLALAAQQEGPAVAKMVSKVVGSAIGAALGGSSVLAAIEAARFVGEALKPIKELGEDLVTPEDEKR
jgi:phage gpG-like protein